MNRLDQTLSKLKDDGRKALVTYIVSGDPEPGVTLGAMNALVNAGADIIELGVPFSDPMAEGPVIQKAHERALEHGTSLRKTLSIVAEFRTQNNTTPVVLMGYANPVEKMGYETFVGLAKDAGVDGLLTVDLPPEECIELDSKLKTVDISNIFLIAPTTSSARINEICAASRGFVYYVSVKGVTGAGTLDIDSVAQGMERIKTAAKTPVLVGFGIKDAESAKAIGSLADGVIVGSALVKLMEENANDPQKINTELESLVSSMRKALDEL